MSIFDVGRNSMKHLSVRYVSELDFKEKLAGLLEEYNKADYKSILFHVYSGVLDKDLVVGICQKIKASFDTDQIAGSISAGEIKNGRLMDRGVLISVMMFESAEVKLHRFSAATGKELEYGQEIKALADSTPDIKGLELMLPGTNLETKTLFEEISKCNKSIQVFGGYAGGHSMESSEHYVFDQNGLYSDLIFCITYAGADFHITVDKSVGWQTLGVPFKVTKADGNRLIEVDGRPAVELYEKYMQIEADENFAEETFEFPLMAELDGEELLRHTITVEDDGTLDLAGYVTEGMNIYLCYGAPADIVKKVDSRLIEVCDFKPQAILLYSCSVRKSFWEDFVNIEMLPFQQIAETAGFHTWGEVNRDKKNGNVLEYNITLMSIAMREGDPAPGKPLRVHVDDSVLKGQASLIKRLTKLVYATTTELHKAYTNVSKLNDQLQIIADHDGLTKLYNRCKTEQFIHECYDSVNESGNVAGLIMMDIDFFKKVNDTYGHAVGDQVLIKVSELMQEAISEVEGSCAGRWGGEEFMLLVPNCDNEKTLGIAEKLRKSIESTDFGTAGHVTASLGTITFNQNSDLMSVFTNLDKALYKAKKSGRNMTVKSES